MKNKKVKMAFLILLIIITFIVGMSIGGVIEKNKTNIEKRGETTQVVEVEVGTQTIENTLTNSGEILSSGTEKLELDTSKYFKTMCVEENDIVLKGRNILEYSNGTYLTAEYDCLISSYSVPETGSKCASSNYVEVENLEKMQLQIQVSETEINKVAKDQEVEIELSALEDKKFTGTIKSVNNAGTYSSSGTTFTAIIEFENDGNVKPGMSASCTIVLEKAEDCIAVPIEAVQTNNAKKYVVISKTDGTTENVNVETGISDDSYVQILSGLSGGETIQMIQTVTNNNANGNLGSGKMDAQGGSREMNQRGEGQMPFDMEMPSGMDIPSAGERMPNQN